MQDVDGGQAVATPALEVVRVVAGRHLHSARAVLRVDEVVGHDGKLAAQQRQAEVLADDVAVAIVVRVHGHGGVAEHRLGPGGGHLDPAVAVHERVADRGQVSGYGLVRALEVRKHGGAARAPVHQPFAAVDEAFVIEADERLAHGAGQARIHGETLAGPVAGCAERLELLEDACARLGLPFPNAVDEGLAPEVVAGLVLLGELALDHHLGGDAGMIGARQPEHVVPGQAAVAAQHVLEGVVQGVAQMERARHVGRRDHDGEGRPRVVCLGVEQTAVEPRPIPARLDGARVESRRKCGVAAAQGKPSLASHAGPRRPAGPVATRPDLRARGRCRATRLRPRRRGGTAPRAPAPRPSAGSPPRPRPRRAREPASRPTRTAR